MKPQDRRIIADAAADTPRYEIFSHPSTPRARVVLYFREQSAAELLHYTIAPVAGGMAFGACVGVVAAGPGGAVIGGGIGLAGGITYSTYVNYHAYREWVALHKETAVFNEFEHLHEAHPALQEFIDPVTHSLALDPVRDPFGQIYDRSTLIALSNRRASRIMLDHHQNREFVMSEVQDAPEVLAKMKAVYKVLLQQELASDVAPAVRKGLKALIDDLDKQIINYVTRETTRLTGRLRSGEVSLQQFTEQMSELTHRMNPSV